MDSRAMAQQLLRVLGVFFVVTGGADAIGGCAYAVTVMLDELSYSMTYPVTQLSTAAIYIVVGLVLLLAPRPLAAAIVRDERRCPKCGYDLTHAVGAACPECGAPAGARP